MSAWLARSKGQQKQKQGGGNWHQSTGRRPGRGSWSLVQLVRSFTVHSATALSPLSRIPRPSPAAAPLLREGGLTYHCFHLPWQMLRRRLSLGSKDQLQQAPAGPAGDLKIAVNPAGVSGAA